MFYKCKEIVDYLEQFVPLKLSQNWDNSGLLLGDPEQQIKKILVVLDITYEVVEEAIRKKVDLIITHHPLIFKSLNNIRKDNPLGNLIFRLIQNNIGVYSVHTNLDIVPNGVNDVLASTLQLEDVELLEVLSTEPLKKIVVFTPLDHIEVVREAMARAGAGFIGNYSDCSFITKGIGTFRPLEGANPYIGEEGTLEHVEEGRIETIVPESMLKKVIEAMLKVHPYEEVAYDVYNVENTNRKYGFARIGRLSQPMELGDFIKKVKEVLNINMVKAAGDLRTEVKKVVVSAGAYSSNIAKIAKKKGADVIVTGDLKYHEAREIVSLGLCAVDAGHFATENVIISVLCEYLSKLEGIEIFKSEELKDVFIFC